MLGILYFLIRYSSLSHFLFLIFHSSFLPYFDILHLTFDIRYSTLPLLLFLRPGILQRNRSVKYHFIFTGVFVETEIAFAQKLATVAETDIL